MKNKTQEIERRTDGRGIMALGSRVSVETAKEVTQGTVTLLYSGTVHGVGTNNIHDYRD